MKKLMIAILIMSVLVMPVFLLVAMVTILIFMPLSLFQDALTYLNPIGYRYKELQAELCRNGFFNTLFNKFKNSISQAFSLFDWGENMSKRNRRKNIRNQLRSQKKMRRSRMKDYIAHRLGFCTNGMVKIAEQVMESLIKNNILPKGE